MDASADDAGGRDGAALEFEVQVYGGLRGTTPLADAEVRVERADGNGWEATTDEDGRALIVLARSSAPWTVTAAKIGHGAVSMLGVTEPLQEPLTIFSPRDDDMPPAIANPRFVRGAIVGRQSGRDGVILTADELAYFGDRGASYQAVLHPNARTRFSAFAQDRGLDWQLPSSATWLEIDPAASDLDGIDIVFPPALPHRTTRILLRIPITGATAGIDRIATSFSRFGGAASAIMKVGSRWVGTGRGELDATLEPERWDWTIESLDLGPEVASTDLIDGTQTKRIVIETALVDGAEVVVPPVSALAAGFDEDGVLRVDWDAPGYEEGTAVLGPAGVLARGQTWRISGRPQGQRRWPALPSAVRVQDLGLTGLLDVAVSVTTRSDQARVEVSGFSDVDVEPAP